MGAPEGNERPATADELAAKEHQARHSLIGWLEAYVEFPTDTNRSGVIERLDAYRFAWMNGRKRP